MELAISQRRNDVVKGGRIRIMTGVVIVDAVRTAIGKMGGTLKNVEVDYLAAKVIDEVLKRNGIEGSEVDEVIMGQAKQSTDAPNMARVALLRAGLPVEVPGYTVHRQCGSGLQAINNAAQQIQCGLASIIVAGGAESMSTAPYYIRGARYGLEAGNGLLLDPNTESQPRSQPPEIYGKDLTMGLTAEILAEKYQISRQEQDEFAFLSQSRAAYAISSGKFENEIVPFEVKLKKEMIHFKIDEHPRLTPVEKLLTLPPVFKKDGTVTAGNSSGRNDGAAAVLVMSEIEAEKRGLKPKARILAQAVSGVSPEIMGIGPVPATRKALKMAGLQLEDIDLIELNEAFAAQSLAVIKELGLRLEKVNVNGGAIALGHPVGATGAILMTKLIHEMERRGSRYGLVTLCIGGGQGITTIVENLRR
ncbi:thiolase family protein [Parageobacillus thermoglucosidasius]|uniref:acetyl-CoA C-acetyltransferase n=3 Tax=Anoxybacillaceae TaxID=3120669 RepID=A0AAN1D709_PARTM|nr:thiolase family protein [Parageobacillus thermoglucosidasius]ALF10506.1 acetyl-CoA acetyltransferase [Parageobacillus thermoglucosidasius]ANZ30585.1 acetyl-CoA acetyltransferase [Parageobacillus thermoglucosidasius]APM81324.1 acetyl-CoA acetyltransferase [Parageobacillus thermoglucosidasius]KJX68112.1 acetyl-CoA acetyltransferase [Parageobacillus thermoglucosidasius]MED4905857.1 thiolase family protein [Parageobacillus thermoglucosidasius]